MVYRSKTQGHSYRRGEGYSGELYGEKEEGSRFRSVHTYYKKYEIVRLSPGPGKSGRFYGVFNERGKKVGKNVDTITKAKQLINADIAAQQQGTKRIATTKKVAKRVRARKG